MNKRVKIENMIIEQGGIIKTSKLNSEGIDNYELVRLCNSGFLERIKTGYYKLSNAEGISEEQLINTFFSNGIICMESALFYYGYSDYTPHKWTIAVSRSITRSKLNNHTFMYKLYFVQDSVHQLGKTNGELNGMEVSIYDRERTICDCFKYRSKLDQELFNKALHAYVTDEHKNLSNLSKYAKEMKLSKKINDVMEVLLNRG